MWNSWNEKWKFLRKKVCQQKKYIKNMKGLIKKNLKEKDWFQVMNTNCWCTTSLVFPNSYLKIKSVHKRENIKVLHLN